ncbi:Uncharacterized protein GBIM_03540 [Gryllus bimaculatus]|nr:Uncharacterized protein GBIM_03540 [Gryllus bimaculatus]
MASSSLATLQSEAKVNGLTEELLNLCSTFIASKCHSSSLMQTILKCMIPKYTVPDDVVRCVLKWVHRNVRKVNLAVLCALQWVAGLIEFGLADEKPVNEYYNMFHLLMEWPRTENIACWLVVRLTKPDDIDRNMVLKFTSNVKAKKSVRDIVLWCYKTYKPECVPEAIAARSIKSTLKLSPYFKYCFGMSHQRIADNENFKLTHDRQNQLDFIWKVPERKKRRIENPIPEVEYIYFGSKLYQEKKVSILQINSWKTFATLALQIDIPCNAVSLVQNPIGHHVLACGDENLQTRFSYTLLNLLQNVVIDRLVKVSMENQEYLLEKICEFQEYSQQGIPFMSKFVATYLVFWDGLTFLSQLMRLLPWITFSSFGELKSLFLVHLYYVYISSNTMVKCSILRALLQLAENLILKSYSVVESLFRHPPLLDNAEDILNELIKYIQSLCVLGLNFEPGSAVLLHEVLRLYEILLDVEERAGLNVRSVLPPAAVYFSLFSRNYGNIERVCGLLLKYDASIGIQRSLQIQVPGGAKLVKKYSCDYINFLWHMQAMSESKKGFIFKGVEPDAFAPVENVDKAFNVMECIPLISVYHKHGDTEEGLKNFIRELRTLAPNIFNFIKHNLHNTVQS